MVLIIRSRLLQGLKLHHPYSLIIKVYVSCKSKTQLTVHGIQSNNIYICVSLPHELFATGPDPFQTDQFSFNVHKDQPFIQTEWCLFFTLKLYF